MNKDQCCANKEFNFINSPQDLIDVISVLRTLSVLMAKRSVETMPEEKYALGADQTLDARNSE